MAHHTPLFALSLMLLFGCAAPSPVPLTGTTYVVAIGPVEVADTERTIWAMGEITRRPVVLLAPLALSTDVDVHQEASALLDTLLRVAPPDTYRIVGVTSAPLKAPRQGDNLIGYARVGERALIYSVTEMGGLRTEAAHRRRVRRVLMHELGHTFGAGHCAETCVMRGTAGGTDLLPDRPCPLHAATFEAGLNLSPGSFDALVDLGAEQLRLGRWHQSESSYRAALRIQPRNARLQTALGLALMAGSNLLSADEAFGEATRIAPGAPQPYYARAVLYAVGGHAQRAPAFLEAAVQRDGRALRAHRAAGILYQDVLADQTQAIRHFQTHVSLGGRDPEVIARLVYLLSPSTVVFLEPEMVAVRWDPSAGLQVAALR